MMFDRQAKLALLVAALTLAVCGVGFRFAARASNTYFTKLPVPLRQPLSSIPRHLGPWRAVGEDTKVTVELEEALGTSTFLSRTYVRGEGREAEYVGVHIPYYTGLIDAVPHVPDRCAVAHGMVIVGLPANVDLPLDQSEWSLDPERTTHSGEPYPLVTYRHRVTGKKLTVRMPLGDFRLRFTEFRDGQNPDIRHFAGYFFIANGRTTPNPEGVRKFAFDLKNRYAYYAKVQIAMNVSDEESSEEFIDAVADLATELLPELMQCLPDWSEIDSADTG
jgi:hypothetical protein